jgi:hypothetical protein
MKRIILLLLGVSVLAVEWRLSVDAQQPSADGPRYAENGQLLRPADYRDWVYLTSGLGMTYGPAGAGNPPGNFDNVFVSRAAYQRFMTMGKWPAKTMFVLEIRRADQHVSINNGGYTQGDVVTLEASVKDEGRFPETGWAYFAFGTAPSVAPLPASASCYSCHRQNTAVEWTFVQFYPTLMGIARRMGTVKPEYVDKH